jgi:hypothetical protein
MDAAVAALVGAAVGALGVLGSAWIQQTHQSRRDRLKAATDLALADFKQRLSIVKKKGGTLAPLAVYVSYHAEVLKRLETGKFDAAAVDEIDREQIALLKAIRDRPSGKQIAERAAAEAE